MPDTAVAPARAAGPGQPRQHVVALDLMRLLIVAFVVGVHTLTIGGGKVTMALGAFVTVFHTSRELFFLLTAFVLTYNYGGAECAGRDSGGGATVSCCPLTWRGASSTSSPTASGSTRLPVR